MNQDILKQAEELLGQAVKVETSRDWAIFWCPFHNDADRAGNGGHANFGVHLEQGYWACLRCGVKGGSLNALSRKLGKVPNGGASRKPIQPASAPHRYMAPSQTALLDEALAETRAHVQTSPAWAYLMERGLEAYTALVYGLGYGLPKPHVSGETLQAAYQSRLVMSKKMWLWAGSVVYADPPIHPSVINVRYLPEDRLPPDTRGERFVPEENHRTWGNRICPLGAWRIGAQTKTLVVLEGLFDMLLFAQALRQRGMDSEVTAVYTSGACPSARIMDWFSLHNQYNYLLIRDPDEAGSQWTVAIAKAIQRGNGDMRIAVPPDLFDPDEAILHGWWPSNL